MKKLFNFIGAVGALVWLLTLQVENLVMKNKIHQLEEKVTAIEVVEEARWEGIKMVDPLLIDSTYNVADVNKYMFRTLRDYQNGSDK